MGHGTSLHLPEPRSDRLCSCSRPGRQHNTSGRGRSSLRRPFRTACVSGDGCGINRNDGPCSLFRKQFMACCKRVALCGLNRRKHALDSNPSCTRLCDDPYCFPGVAFRICGSRNHHGCSRSALRSAQSNPPVGNERPSCGHITGKIQLRGRPSVGGSHATFLL